LPALNVLSAAEYYRGRYGRSAQLLRESLELSRKSAGAWRALLRDLGFADEAERAWDEAIAVLDRPGAIRRGAGDGFGLVLSFSELGTYFDLRGDVALNVRFYEVSRRVYERMGNAQGQALSLNNLGVYLRHQGELARALDHLERGLAIHEGTADRQGAAVALQNLAMLKLALGDVEGSEAGATRALAFARELGIAWLTGHGHRLIGRAAAARGALDQADRELTRAEGLFRMLGNPRSMGDVLLDRAEVAFAQGNDERGRAMIDRARQTGEEEKGLDFLCRQKLIEGRAAKEPGRAVSDLEAALGYGENVAIAELVLDCQRAIAEAHARHGTLRLAQRSHERARELEERFVNGLPADLRERYFRFGPNARARAEAKRVQERLLAEERE
jgi:tetratricopeptide (TPR) repeat protein